MGGEDERKDDGCGGKWPQIHDNSCSVLYAFSRVIFPVVTELPPLPVTLLLLNSQKGCLLPKYFFYLQRHKTMWDKEP